MTKKMMTAAVLATLIASPALARPAHHHASQAYASQGQWVPNGAARDGEGAIQLEERKDAQSGYE